MSRLFSLTDLETRARRRADIEFETDRFPPAEVWDEINASNASLHLMLVGARGAEYFEKYYRTISAIAGGGTSPPTITVKGVAALAYAAGVVVKLLAITGGNLPSTMQFSVDGGTTWSSTATLAGNYTDVPLPGTGFYVTFPAGTYHANNTWTWTPTQFVTTSGTTSYALPYDFLELAIVETVIGGRRIQMDRYEKNERALLLDLRDWYSLTAVPKYRIRGDARYEGQATIDFAPGPQGAYNIDLFYCPQVEKFDLLSLYAGGEGTKFHFDTGHEEWLVLDVATKLLTKENLPLGNRPVLMAAAADRITKVAPVRDASAPERVVDRSEQWIGRQRVLW